MGKLREPEKLGKTSEAMLSGLFQATTIPVLEQMVSFAQTRQNLLAANIANMDTPGYQAHDLPVEAFQARLKAAIEDRDHPSTLSPGEANYREAAPLADVARSIAPVLRHDQEGMETQAAGMSQNQMQHNLAISLLVSQFHLLQAAISEQA